MWTFVGQNWTYQELRLETYNGVTKRFGMGMLSQVWGDGWLDKLQGESIHDTCNKSNLQAPVIRFCEDQ